MARFDACSERTLTCPRLFFSLKDEFCQRTASDEGQLQRFRWRVRTVLNALYSYRAGRGNDWNEHETRLLSAAGEPAKSVVARKQR
jgi:hypothetical protein